MKTQLIIIALLFTILSCKAQTPIINQTTYTTDQMEDGMYLKDMDNILNRFVGTWKWENGNSSFEIVFEKADMVLYPNNTYSDIIKGKFKYIKDGILITNNLNETFTPLLTPIHGGFSDINHNKLNITFHDSIKHKAGTGYFELVTGTSPQQAKWKARGSGGAKFLETGDSPSTPGFTLPIIDEIILVKQ